MNLDKSKQLKIDTSMKLNKKNVMTPTSQISKPICIEAGTNVSKEKKKKNKKKRQKRCGHKDCNVKLALTSMTCKCGVKFCMKHFSFTKHDCPYDYVAEARENLEKKNVLGGGEYDKVKDRI